MVDSIVKITLDLQQASSPVSVSVKRGDIGRKIIIALSDGGFPYEITEDCYAVLTATKPDGNILYNRCIIDGNTVIYEVTEQTTSAAGRMLAEVKLYGEGDRLITSASFRIVVHEPVCSDEQVESTYEASALTQLVTDAREIVSQGEEIIDAAQRAVNVATESADTAAQAAAEAVAVADAAEQRINEAVNRANTAAERAERYPEAAEEAKEIAEEALQNVNTLREVVSSFHSNIQETAKGEVITVSDASDLPLAGLKVFGKTTQNGIPTPTEPAELVNVGDVTVTVAGRNLFDVPHLAVNGTGNRKDNANQSIADGVLRFTRANITSKAPKFFVNLGAAVPFLGKTLYLKAKAKASTSVAKFGFGIGFYKETTNTIKNAAYSAFPSATTEQELSCTFIVPDTLDESSPNLGMVVYVDNAAAITTQAVGDYVDYWDIMISFDDVAYEPYKGKTLPISTDNGLPGIWDSTGNQWLCDEVDFEKGVYVQRVILLENFSGAPFNDALNLFKCSEVAYTLMSGGANIGMCSVTDVYEYSTSNKVHYYVTGSGARLYLPKEFDNTGNVIKVLAALAEPVYHDLTAEQLAAFAELHSNYPNTVAFNDKSAEMEVKYVADTKLYIDKKFNELAAALVSNV